MKKLKIELIVPDSLDLHHITGMIENSLTKWKFPSSQVVGNYVQMDMQLVLGTSFDENHVTLVLMEKTDENGN